MVQKINFLSSVWDNLAKATYSISNARTKEPLLEFDSILESHFHGSANSTQIPTENGFKKTEYKYGNPDDLRIKGVVSKNGTVGIGFAEFNYSIHDIDKNNLIENIRAQCDILTKNIILVNIQTRNSGLRKNYTMVDYVIDETPDNFNLLEVDMAFDQVVLFDKAGNINRSIADQDRVNVGIVETLKQNLGEWWNNDANLN